MAVYTVLEVANTHGGSLEYVFSLIDQFKEFDKDHGIKFQPFKYDEIATSSYQWYPVYEKLFFDEKAWDNIISHAKETKDVWLDLFDTYGVAIAERNLSYIKGIKLQASVLQNSIVLNALSKLELSDKEIIINISAYSLEEISGFSVFIEELLSPKELLFEVGFQSYPTELADSGLSKITHLKEHFPNRIVFADHIDGQHEDAIWLPIIATLNGADIIEKHIQHDTHSTEYDYFSSLTIDQYKKYHSILQRYAGLQDQPFINHREVTYLEKTVQIPITKTPLPAQTLVNIVEDLEFKRSGEFGLSGKEVQSLQRAFHILSVPKKAGESFKPEDFKKATLGVVVACRLKSSRLEKKALATIGNITSVEYCLKNCLKLDNINQIVLATSTNEQDSELINYTYSNSVKFFQGHPEDVIQRYIDVADVHELDVIIRVTADMPFVSDEICQILLKSHFENGADYTTAKEAAVGTNLEIFNISCLKYLKQFFPNADYSEYMTWYFQNNPEHFKLNFVELPETLVRGYRLTLDYDEDLQMFNRVDAHLKSLPAEYSIHKLFEYLDAHPDVTNMNHHIQLTYKVDKALIDTLNSETKIGNAEL